MGPSRVAALSYGHQTSLKMQSDHRSSKDRYRPDDSGFCAGSDLRSPVANDGHARDSAAVSQAAVNVKPRPINTQNRACLSISSFLDHMHNTSDQNGVATTD